MKIKLISQELDLEQSELLADLSTTSQEAWPIVRGNASWQVAQGVVTGMKSPGEIPHSQIFYGQPFQGEVVMEFDARLLKPYRHDLVWFFQTSFEEDPWGEGYIGCLGGWYGDYAGIEKIPSYRPSGIFAWKKIELERDYHIVSGVAGGVVFIAVDGAMIFYMTDATPILAEKAGYCGLGLYDSNVEYRNIKIYRPQVNAIPFGYSD